MTTIASGGQKFRNSQLRWSRRYHVENRSQRYNFFLISPRSYPTDPKSRRKGFGKRGAQENESLLVKTLRCDSAGRAKGQITAHIIFDQRNIVPRQKFHKLTLLRFWHQASQWVIEIRNDVAGLNRCVLYRVVHKVKFYSFSRVGWNFQYFESKHL